MQTSTPLSPFTSLPVSLSALSEAESWYAIQSCARHEKCIATELERRGVEHFLPLYRSARQWRDRRVLLDLPLFPGYLFVRLALKEKLKVLQVRGVVRLVGFSGQPYPLPPEEIDALRAGILHGLSVQPHPFLTVGCRVRVMRGPLAGFEGILLRKKKVYRVVLSLSLIAQSATVEVSATDVQSI
ncbi:MAG: UpxY family transcription antiterminator [Candidatus Acidiferrum sp.]